MYHSESGDTGCGLICSFIDCCILSSLEQLTGSYTSSSLVCRVAGLTPPEGLPGDGLTAL